MIKKRISILWVAASITVFLLPPTASAGERYERDGILYQTDVSGVAAIEGVSPQLSSLNAGSESVLLEVKVNSVENDHAFDVYTTDLDSAYVRCIEIREAQVAKMKTDFIVLMAKCEASLWTHERVDQEINETIVPYAPRDRQGNADLNFISTQAEIEKLRDLARYARYELNIVYLKR